MQLYFQFECHNSVFWITLYDRLLHTLMWCRKKITADFWNKKLLISCFFGQIYPTATHLYRFIWLYVAYSFIFFVPVTIRIATRTYDIMKWYHLYPFPANIVFDALLAFSHQPSRTSLRSLTLIRLGFMKVVFSWGSTWHFEAG